MGHPFDDHENDAGIDSLLSDSQMHAAGDKYQTALLREVAGKVFEARCQNQNLSEAQFKDTAKHPCSTTPKDDAVVKCALVNSFIKKFESAP